MWLKYDCSRAPHFLYLFEQGGLVSGVHFHAEPVPKPEWNQQPSVYSSPCATLFVDCSQPRQDSSTVPLGGLRYSPISSEKNMITLGFCRTSATLVPFFQADRGEPIIFDQQDSKTINLS